MTLSEDLLDLLRGPSVCYLATTMADGVALAVSSPENPSRYVQVRGAVIDVTTEGAVDHIEKLSHKYTGKPYSWYGGRDQERVIFVIEPVSVSG